MEVTVTRLAGRRLGVDARGVTTIVDDLESNGGPGDGFRPTELLLAALGACTSGTMIAYADSHGVPLENVRVVLESEKVGPPSRLDEISMRIEVDGPLSDIDLDRLRRAAGACTVHTTLKTGPAVTVELARP